MTLEEIASVILPDLHLEKGLDDRQYTAITYILTPWYAEKIGRLLTKEECRQVIKLLGSYTKREQVLTVYDEEQFDWDYKFIWEAWYDDK